MNRRRFLRYAAIILTVLSMSCQVGSATVQPYRQFQKGMNYAAWWHDTYLTAESDRSLEALADTGTNWVALIVTWYQDNYTDSSMKPDADRTPTDASLIHAIQMIHRLGMRIMLKPHIDLFETEQWRGEIQPTNEKAWFDSYRAFITHYAELAQTNDVEMLSVGTELNLMTQRGHTAYWLAIIDAARRVYEGELTYAANWWPDSAWQDLGFLKELDYLGIDAYFPLTEKKDPTINELKRAWQQWISQIEAWQNLNGKQIILTEIGYRDLDGANIHPWDWQIEGSQDQQEQADCYQAALETFWGKPWLHGIFWWAWTYEQQPLDYTPWGKLAEGVLRDWYAKPYVPQRTLPEMVPGDLVAWRPSSGTWYVRHQDGPSWTQQWGTSGDVPLIGDVDGDGLGDLIVWRPSNGYWYVLKSSTNYDRSKALRIQWGTSGDTPLVGRFDSDALADLIVWRPSTGMWYVLKSSTGYDRSKAFRVQWGTSGDNPLVGDVDGDGLADLIVWRPSNGYWYALKSTVSYDRSLALRIQWGTSTDKPLVGGYDSDGLVDLSVWRPSNGVWYVLKSSANYDRGPAARIQYGMSGDRELMMGPTGCLWCAVTPS